MGLGISKTKVLLFAVGDDPEQAPSNATVDAALTGKASSSHSHVISDVTGLQAALDGKQTAGSYAASVHTHSVSDTTGLQTALDGKLGTTGNGSGLTGLTTGQISGLGTIATQAASSVTITGGSISGITDLAVADGGTGASSAPAARSNLGCGTAATKDAPASGNAAAGEVVLGNDTRLTDSRTPTTHTHDDRYFTESEIIAGYQPLDATTTALAAWDWSSGVEVATFTADDTLSVLRVGTSANELVQLNGSSQIPAVSGALLTNLNASNLASGTVPTARLGSGTADATTILYGNNTWGAAPGGAAYENVWSSDTVEAFTSGTYKAILTTSSLATGCYEVTAIINTRRATAATVGTRWIAGTASLAGASGDALGHAMLEGSTITQITLAATSPWTTSQAVRFSPADGATHLWRMAFEVTSAGTVALQMYLNATNNVTIEKGSIVTIRKVS